ncbi:MAG: LLM class F420-dependent oxidoreductase [Acidimicrobiia bacterium]|nr:LLM class F420-dependent oxidoreductase [Acidimicrobiia bacterium]
MKWGFLSANHVGGPRPDVLARELEQRGFDSYWVPEHSHIPVDRTSPYPGGGELPDGYWHMMDPFVSLMAAASATESITLATGICLVLEHDALDLAKTVATLDALSGGRVLLGIGVGWNAEELANHRPDLPFNKRFSAMRDRVAALRAAWTMEEASYEGTWDRFTPSWVYPKPAQASVPIALGNAGPVGIRHAAEYADEWCPIDASLYSLSGEGSATAAIEHFRNLVEEGGRDRNSVPISLFTWGRPKPHRLEAYQEAGVDRLVFLPPTMDTSRSELELSFLDEVAPLIAQFS